MVHHRDHETKLPISYTPIVLYNVDHDTRVIKNFLTQKERWSKPIEMVAKFSINDDLSCDVKTQMGLATAHVRISTLRKYLWCKMHQHVEVTTKDNPPRITY